MSLVQLRAEWFGNIRNDLLAGMVVGLALIPEAIGFSIIAGVDPKVGLYASFCIAVVIAFVGGRSAMVSAATGSMALVMVSLVRDHGLHYLLAATLLTGVLQIVAGVLKLGSLLRFVSRSVVTGFVNALAILIFMAQLPVFKGAGWPVYAMVLAGLAIIYLFPRLTKAVPSPLVAIIVLTAFTLLTGLHIRTVGDMGALPSAFPTFLLPDVPLNLATLRIIFPYSVTLMAVGLLESLMTSVLVDDLTDTPSDKNRECRGQGIANIVAGFFGGMAGCGMIGQSVINVKSGGRGRLSTLFAGVFLLFLILILDDWVRRIPMAALVSVMFMVSISTFKWASVRSLQTNPKSSSLVMVATVVVTVAMNNLAEGVLVGVLMSGVFFAAKVARLLSVESAVVEGEDRRIYTVSGQVFFASADQFATAFDFGDVRERVTIDLTAAHFWDISAVGALDKVVLKFRRGGTVVDVVGLNEASQTIVDKLAVHNKSHALEKMLEN